MYTKAWYTKLQLQVHLMGTRKKVRLFIKLYSDQKNNKMQGDDRNVNKIERNIVIERNIYNKIRFKNICGGS